MTETNSSVPSDPLQRQVFCMDSLPWLRDNLCLPGASIITSLPDASGLPELSLAQWRQWFVQAAQACLQATRPEGVTIFYQTDIKRDGEWVDKGYLCHQAADGAGARLLWHKIICRKPPATPAFGRPGYAHLLCFSKEVRDRVAQSYPDVLAATGKMTWSQATGVAACELACRYVKSHTDSRTIVDPFCGTGAILAVANRMGFASIGVEVSKKRARKARNLVL